MPERANLGAVSWGFRCTTPRTRNRGVATRGRRRQCVTAASQPSYSPPACIARAVSLARTSRMTAGVTMSDFLARHAQSGMLGLGARTSTVYPSLLMPESSRLATSSPGDPWSPVPLAQIRTTCSSRSPASATRSSTSRGLGIASRRPRRRAPSCSPRSLSGASASSSPATTSSLGDAQVGPIASGQLGRKAERGQRVARP